MCRFSVKQTLQFCEFKYPSSVNQALSLKKKLSNRALLSLVYTNAPNGLQTACEPNANMCGWYCEPALCRMWMVRIPFAANQNLSCFCVNRKRSGCTGCPSHALGVLCSPQVCGKLINSVPNTRRSCIRGFMDVICEKSTAKLYPRNAVWWFKFLNHTQSCRLIFSKFPEYRNNFTKFRANPSIFFSNFYKIPSPSS